MAVRVMENESLHAFGFNEIPNSVYCNIDKFRLLNSSNTSAESVIYSERAATLLQ